MRDAYVEEGLLIGLMLFAPPVSAVYLCPQTIIVLPGRNECGPPVVLDPTVTSEPVSAGTTTPSGSAAVSGSGSSSGATASSAAPVLVSTPSSSPPVSVNNFSGLSGSTTTDQYTNPDVSVSGSSALTPSPAAATTNSVPVSAAPLHPVSHKHNHRHRSWFRRLLKDLHL